MQKFICIISRSNVPLGGLAICLHCHLYLNFNVIYLKKWLLQHQWISTVCLTPCLSRSPLVLLCQRRTTKKAGRTLSTKLNGGKTCILNSFLAFFQRQSVKRSVLSLWPKYWILLAKGPLLQTLHRWYLFAAKYYQIISTYIILKTRQALLLV